jgi:acetyltransferase EpsM
MTGSHVLALIGGGGHALVVAEAARATGGTVCGVFDDADAPVTQSTLGLATLGRLGDVAARLPADSNWILCVGDLATRQQVLTTLMPMAGRACAVIDPRAMISPTARVGVGTFIAARAVVQTGAHIGAHCIVNTGAIVEHECQIGSNTHVAPGVTMGGRVRVGSGSLIGLGATILPGIRVGNGSVVGAGAVVVRDVEDGETVVGVPAHHSRRAW